MFPSIAFFIAALILAVTPGPGLAYVVARTASGGPTEVLAPCVGTGLGGMLHVGAAALGLSLLLAQSEVARHGAAPDSALEATPQSPPREPSAATDKQRPPAESVAQQSIIGTLQKP